MMSPKHDAKIVMHLGGLGCQPDGPTNEIRRILTTELMRHNTEKMKARRMAGLYRANFPAQPLCLGQSSRAKMPDRRGKLLGNSGRCLVPARRLRTPQTNLPHRHSASSSQGIDPAAEINQSVARDQPRPERRAVRDDGPNAKNGLAWRARFSKTSAVRSKRWYQKSSVKPVVTALSVAPPIVSLAASRLQT